MRATVERHIGMNIVVAVVATACVDIVDARFDGAHLRPEPDAAAGGNVTGGFGGVSGRQSGGTGEVGGSLETGGAPGESVGGTAPESGTAGSDGRVSTGGVLNTGSTSNAGDGGIDAGDGTAIGSLGQACSPNGAYACTGHAQKGRLVCSIGRWQSNGNCSGNDNCDTTLGPSVGSCQAIAAGCAGQTADALVCQGADILKCGIDLVTTSKVGSCQYLCTDGACTGTCTPTTRQCDMLTPETCDDTGNWVTGTPCTSLCSGGACSGTCSPTATRCNGQVVQTCDSTGTWRDGSACSAQACVSGGCVGVCAPGTKQCANNGVETCSMGGAWGTPTTCVSSACVSGACTGVCVPATKRCSSDGVETCLPSGQWGTASPCTAQSQICSNGVCIACGSGLADCDGGGTGCAPDAGLTMCGKDCVDLMSNDMNCGACGYACVNGRHCVNGIPTPPWLPITTSGAPPSRTGFAAVGLSETMVLAGGSPASATTNVYDSSTDSWPAASPMNSVRCQHNMVSSGTHAYVFGGLPDCSNGESPLANLEEYSPSSRSWKIITASGTPPDARYAFGMAWTGTEVFIYGGSDANSPYLATGGRYNVSAGTWSDARGTLAVVTPVLFESGKGTYLWGGVLASGNNTAGQEYTAASGWITWTVPNQVLPGTNPDDGSRIFVVTTSGSGCSQATQVKIHDRSKGTLLRTDNAPAPNGVIDASAVVWSGSEVIAWSGGCGSNPTDGGGRYQPPAPN